MIGLVILKLASLVAFGPRFEQDSHTYLEYAALILHDTKWWSDAGLDQSWLPVTVFRAIGYPSILALGQWLAGPTGGLYVVVLMQIAVAVMTTWTVWRIASEILPSSGMALLATAGYALSAGFLSDQSIMTDSFFQSLFVVLFGMPAHGLLRQESRMSVRFCSLPGCCSWHMRSGASRFT